VIIVLRNSWMVKLDGVKGDCKIFRSLLKRERVNTFYLVCVEQTPSTFGFGRIDGMVKLDQSSFVRWSAFKVELRKKLEDEKSKGGKKSRNFVVSNRFPILVKICIWLIIKSKMIACWKIRFWRPNIVQVL